MRRYGLLLLLFVPLAVSLLMPQGAPTETATRCNSATMNISATFPNDEGFEGMWKYTVTGSFDLGEGSQGLSHISFLFQLDCDCICELELRNFFAFDYPAGTCTGEDSLANPCTVEYLGLLECQGDPFITSNLPAFKFEAPNGQGCETTEAGTGTWWFYSYIPPMDDASYIDAIVIKYGNNECTGDLYGQMPICDCNVVPTSEKTWGAIKSNYDE
jgi:hypothetical protein